MSEDLVVMKPSGKTAVMHTSTPGSGERWAGICVMLAVLCLLGCGYRFSADRTPVIDIETVHIPPMTNTTTKVGIETQFTNDLIFEVSRHGHSDIVDRDAAEGVLEGVIRDLRTGSIARSSISTTLQRRVRVRVDLTLKDRKGKPLWRASLSDVEEYTVLPDKTSTEGNLRRALAVISRRLAEKFYFRFTAAF